VRGAILVLLPRTRRDGERSALLLRCEKVIVRLKVNRVVPGAVDPNWLKSFHTHWFSVAT
jgi:hypothetical protein